MILSSKIRSTFACTITLLLATMVSSAPSNDGFKDHRISKKASNKHYKVSSKISTTASSESTKTQLGFEGIELEYSFSMSYSDFQEPLIDFDKFGKTSKSSKKGAKMKKQQFDLSDKAQHKEPTPGKPKDKNKKPHLRKKGSPSTMSPTSTVASSSKNPTASPASHPTVLTPTVPPPDASTSVPTRTSKSSGIPSEAPTGNTTSPSIAAPTASPSPTATIAVPLLDVGDEDTNENGDEAPPLPDIRGGDIDDDDGFMPLIGSIVGLLVLVLCSLAFLRRNKRSVSDDQVDV
jgi:hypothetical protein